MPKSEIRLKNILTLKYRSTETHDKIPYRVFPMHRPYYLGTLIILNIACIKIISLSFEGFMNHIPQC